MRVMFWKGDDLLIAEDITSVKFSKDNVVRIFGKAYTPYGGVYETVMEKFKVDTDSLLWIQEQGLRTGSFNLKDASYKFRHEKL